MNNQTIHQVDPIALRKKLARLGIGPKFQFSQTASMDAARDFGNHAATNVEFTTNDIVDAVEVVAETDSIAPGTCILEPAEIAYLIHAWAMLWEIPA